MKRRKVFLALLVGVSVIFSIKAQELRFSQVSQTELNKAAKDGRYGGTFIHDKGVDVVYVYAVKKEGTKLDTYTFNKGLNFEKRNDGDLNDQTGKNFTWYCPKEKAEVLSPSGGKWIRTGRTFGGGMKFWLGTMKKQYVLGVFTDMVFEEEKELKAKTGDVWRLYASGYKSLTNFDAVDATSGFNYQLKKYGDNIVVPANDPVLAAGVIQEKVRIKSPTLYAANRIAVMSISGENFENPDFNIYIHPYSAMTMATGLGQDDNLCCVFAPLNAPTKGVGGSLDYLYWKDRKDMFSMYRFSDSRELIDSVSFQSKLLWGDFQIKNGLGATFLVGKGKSDFDGWARNGGMAVKKIDGVQVTKIKNGTVLYSKLLNNDQLEEKLVAPEGSKVKFNMAVANNYIIEALPLPNGDDLVMGRTPFQTYMLQLSADGELKTYYQIPAINAKEDRVYNHQILVKGDYVYLVLNEQPHDFSNETQIDTHTSTIQGAGVSTTITTTTVKRLNQVFLRSQLLRLDINARTLSNALVMDGKNFYSLGSSPALITQDAIYFTGIDKGPGGKKISLAKVDL